MITIAVAGAVVALGALILVSDARIRALLRMIDEIQPRDIPAPELPNEALKAISDRLEAVEREIPTLYKAVADGIDHVDRNEKRVRGIITGAQRRFEAAGYVDAGVDAEADTVALQEGEVRENGLLGLPVEEEPGEEQLEMSPWNVVPGMR